MYRSQNSPGTIPLGCRANWRGPVVARLLGALALLAGAPALAADAPALRGGSFLAEFQGSVGGPLGRWGVELGYDHRGALAVGLGVGINRELSERHSLPPLALFGRWLPWQRGGLALGLGGGVGRQFHAANEGLASGGSLNTSWNPGYRVDVAADAVFGDNWWFFRLETGLGYFFTNPTCNYEGGSTYYSGDCDSASIPPQYHHTIAQGRIVPTVTAALGLRLGGSPPEQGSTADDFRPADWAHAVLLGDVLGLGMALTTAIPLGAAVGGPQNANAFGGAPFLGALLLAAAVGTTFGSATGAYIVGRHSARPDGSYRRTLLGSLLGAALAVSATTLVYYASRGPREREEYAIFTGIVSFATLPAAFGAVWYLRSAAESPAAPGLLQVDGAARKISAGSPAVVVSERWGIKDVKVGLIGGRF